MNGKVAALVGPKKIEIKEFELPKPKNGALLAKVLRSNLCGSELHIWKWAHPIIKNAVLGHEMIGEIYELGEGVESDYDAQPVKPGDRIVAPYYVTCRKCPACARGDFNLCQNAYRGWSQPPEKPPHFTGTFATHYYIQADQYFYKVPENLPSDIVAGVNCGLSQVIYGIDQANLKNGETMVIQGAGGLGLYATAVAKEKGARVVVVDAISERLDMAADFGADHLVDCSGRASGEIIEAVTKLTGGLGADVVLEVAGVPQAFSEALEMVRTAGRVISIGNVSLGEGHEVAIAPGLITRKCAVVIGVVRYQPWYLRKSLEFLERMQSKVDFAKMSATEFSLAEVNDALVQADERRVIRAAIVPSLK
jgi:D-arabinose 1-dehydrogenase-like Zn-dependent alcohol dehydrogenase